jgi:putative ABC transport system permease protein
MAADRLRRALPFKLLLGLAARNVGRNKARSALSLAAIATGVAGLILSGGFVHDLIYQLGEALIHSQSGHVQIARSGYFEFGSRSPGKYLISSEEAERAEIGKLEHVDAIMRRVGFSALLSNGRSSYPIVGEGIEAEQEAKLGTYIVLLAGRTLSSQDRYAALVGAGVARAMDLKPGSHVSLVAPTVDEAMNTVDLEVVGTFQSFSKDYDDRVIKVPLRTAQELLDTKGVNVLVLLLDETRHTATVARTLADRLKTLGLEVNTWDWLNDFYWKAVALYERQFGVLRLIVLLMVALAVIGAINVGVLERAGEFGTMRALGNTSWDVFRLVVMEGALMGMLGALMGVALGVGLAWIISAVGIPMPPPPNSNLEYTASITIVPSVIVGAFFVGLVATILASIVPALRVSRLPVVEALRRIA